MKNLSSKAIEPQEQIDCSKTTQVHKVPSQLKRRFRRGSLLRQKPEPNFSFQASGFNSKYISSRKLAMLGLSSHSAKKGPIATFLVNRKAMVSS
jgi:hypothetical protein